MRTICMDQYPVHVSLFQSSIPIFRWSFHFVKVGIWKKNWHINTMHYVNAYTSPRFGVRVWSSQ